MRNWHPSGQRITRSVVERSTRSALLCDESGLAASKTRCAHASRDRRRLTRLIQLGSSDCSARHSWPVRQYLERLQSSSRRVKGKHRKGGERRRPMRRRPMKSMRSMSIWMRKTWRLTKRSMRSMRKTWSLRKTWTRTRMAIAVWTRMGATTAAGRSMRKTWSLRKTWTRTRMAIAVWTRMGATTAAGRSDGGPLWTRYAMRRATPIWVSIVHSCMLDMHSHGTG